MEYIAIDIGGSQIKSGIVSRDGTILDRSVVDTPRDGSSEQLLELLLNLVQRRCSARTAGVGISTLGAVDGARGVVTGACENLPSLHGLPIKSRLEASLGLPVRVSNDVNAAALGEARFGAGKGLEQFYCLTLGTGIGGAYVVGGRVLTGTHGQAGEIGYLHRSGDSCYEQRASVSSFLRRCRAQGDTGNDREIMKSAILGRSHAPLFHRWTQEVADGLCELIYLLDPGTILIGGGVSCYGELLCRPIRDKVNASLLPDFSGKTVIRAAETGNDANLLGAVVSFLN